MQLRGNRHDATHRYDAAVRCRRRVLYALTPAVLVLLVAGSPAALAHGNARRVGGGATTIRDVESFIGGLSAGIVERVPIPTIGPAYEAAETGFAAAASLSWIALVLAAAITLGCVGLPRRDRAPPHRLCMLPA
jgi:hypothetical protein